MDKSRILEILQCHHAMTLATIRPDGYPQATTVNYAHDNLTLFFATDAASQKAGNIKRNNKVSIAIASETSDLYRLFAACRCWAQLKGYVISSGRKN